MAKGKTCSFGGFTSPRVPAGQYKAVITKGKDVFEHVFTVENDPKIGLTAEEYQKKFATTMVVYDMTQELAYMMYELDAYLEYFQENDQKMAKKLMALKETLVITKGDNYVGAAESQLREKMADLYAKLADSYNVPSQAELDNLAALQKRFEEAKEAYAKLKKKMKSAELELMSFEAFIEA